MNNKKINFITQMGFTYKNGTTNILKRDYKYTTIEIDIQTKKINYIDIKDNQLKGFNIGRDTSANLSSEENYSVLECINELLEQGYHPNNITIEKPFSSGSAGKDIYLDILVSFPNDYHIEEKRNNTYMMIEVKKKSEYSKTIKDSFLTKNNGEPKSQLLSYLQQDKNAEYIVYYTSYNNGELKRQYHFVDVLEQGLNEINNLKELFQHWNKVYHTDNGIFENQSIYNNQIIPLRKFDLKDLSNSEDSRKIFYQFLTILRKNTISDKGNAFNKIFNLFICKIKDEDSKDDNDVLDFQWKYNDNEEELLNRLNDLYKQGIYEYLTIEVEDTEEDVFDDLISVVDNQRKEQLKQVYNQLRLYKNNEFAFIEVFDKESFDKNVKIVKEIVQLLETFKLKYNHKQQFLGDFFEHLLNTGLKQENGQFFTPIPIARFIINSLPLEKMIDNKINECKKLQGSKDIELLPYSIDYAAGSGHFLTELMDEYNRILVDKKNSEDFNKLPTNVKNTISNNTNETNLYNWAPEYVYGIEKDYRLAKTAKVACFLNGDGDANMLYGDGLENFQNSTTYIKKLKTNNNSKDNNVFDVIVANPPYSVEGFKDFIKNGSDTFELFDKLGENSDDIECLFMERTKQLLKQGGTAGIVLPTSILENDGIFSHMRNMLLKSFKFKSIVDFSSKGKVFAKTGTNAVILFLEKRNNTEYSNILSQVNDFYKQRTNMTINNIDKLVEKYSKEVYELEFDEYISLLYGDIFEEEIIEEDYENLSDKDLKAKLSRLKIKNKDSYEDYWKTFSFNYQNSKRVWDDKKVNKFKWNDFIGFIKEIEIEKLSLYTLNKSEKCLVITVPQDNKELNSFIGYSFSERSSNEGIQFQKDEEGNYLSKLYNENNKTDETKLNSYIYKHMNNEVIKTDEIDEELKPYIKLLSFNSLVDFKKPNWIKNIKTKVMSDKIYEDANCDYVKFSEKIEDIKGGNGKYTKDYIANNKGKIPLLTGSLKNQSIEDYIVPLVDSDICKENTISVNKDNVSGSRSNYRKYDYVMNSHHLSITLKKDINIKYTNYVFDNYLINNIYGWENTLSSNVIKDLKLPLPSKDIQDKIVEEIELQEQLIEDKKSEISDKQNEIKSILKDIEKNGISTKLEDLCEIIGGTRITQKKNRGTKYPVIGGGGISFYTNNFNSKNEWIIARFAMSEHCVRFQKDNFWLLDSGLKLNCSNDIIKNFIGYQLFYNQNKIYSYGRGNGQKNIEMDLFKIHKISFIENETKQKEYVEELDKLHNEIEILEKYIEDLKDNSKILDKYLKK